MARAPQGGQLRQEVSASGHCQSMRTNHGRQGSTLNALVKKKKKNGASPGCEPRCKSGALRAPGERTKEKGKKRAGRSKAHEHEQHRPNGRRLKAALKSASSPSHRSLPRDSTPHHRLGRPTDPFPSAALFALHCRTSPSRASEL